MPLSISNCFSIFCCSSCSFVGPCCFCGCCLPPFCCWDDAEDLKLPFALPPWLDLLGLPPWEDFRVSERLRNCLSVTDLSYNTPSSVWEISYSALLIVSTEYSLKYWMICLMNALIDFGIKVTMNSDASKAPDCCSGVL